MALGGRRINIFCARNNNLTSKMIVRPKRSLMSIFYFYCWNILEKYFGHKPYTLESSNPFYSLCFWHLGSSHLRPKYSHVHHFYIINTSIRKIYVLLYGYIYFFNRVFLPFESTIFLKRTSLHPTCISILPSHSNRYVHLRQNMNALNNARLIVEFLTWG